VTALLLEKTNAIKDWRALIGPTDAAWAKEVCPETWYAG
jgi:nucleoside diphosphate kinase